MYRVFFVLLIAVACLTIARSQGRCPASSRLDAPALRAISGGQVETGWCWPMQGCDMSDKPCSESQAFWCREEGYEGAVCDDTKEYQYPEACNTGYGNAMCGDLPVTVENVICLKMEKCKCTTSGIFMNCVPSGDWYDPVTDTYDTDGNCSYSTDE